MSLQATGVRSFLPWAHLLIDKSQPYRAWLILKLISPSLAPSEAEGIYARLSRQAMDSEDLSAQVAGAASLFSLGELALDASNLTVARKYLADAKAILASLNGSDACSISLDIRRLEIRCHNPQDKSTEGNGLCALARDCLSVGNYTRADQNFWDAQVAYQFDGDYDASQAMVETYYDLLWTKLEGRREALFMHASETLLCPGDAIGRQHQWFIDFWKDEELQSRFDDPVSLMSGHSALGVLYDKVGKVEKAAEY